jgi:predicted RNase H-like nuclease
VRRVVGFDGCRGGWVAVELEDGAVTRVEVVARFADVLDGTHDATAADVPIGLVDGAIRHADAAARRVLGRRAATVFSTPPRAVVALVAGDPQVSHAEANRVAVAATGVGISIQAFRLLPAIIEVDRLVRAGTDIAEVHPEVAFAHLAGEVLAGKRTWAGAATRRRLLGEAGLVLPERFSGADRCAPDDVLDAAVCALTADRLAGAGPTVTLPATPTQHDGGRPVVIHAPAPSVGASETARA